MNPKTSTTARKRWVIAVVALTVATTGIALGFASCLPSEPEPTGQLGAVQVSEPTRLCVGGVRRDCRRVDAIRGALAQTDLTYVQAAPAPGGQQGAAVLTLRTPEGLTFDAKWRSLGSDSRFNDPIAALAADRVQQLVLTPADVVVPPAAIQCLPAESYDQRLGHHRDPFGDTNCVLGFLSLWLHGTVDMGEARREHIGPGEAGNPDPGLYDPARFESDPRYRRNLANLNLVAFLIAHGDAHAGQFMVYPDPVHVFLVDNSVAFGLDHRGDMDDRQDLARMVVPSIPRDTADRLRALTYEDVKMLRVLVELRVEGRELLPATAGDPFGDEDDRVRTRGDRVQIGLEAEQAELVWTKVLEVRARLDDGSLGVF